MPKELIPLTWAFYFELDVGVSSWLKFKARHWWSLQVAPPYTMWEDSLCIHFHLSNIITWWHPLISTKLSHKYQTHANCILLCDDHLEFALQALSWSIFSFTRWSILMFGGPFLMSMITSPRRPKLKKWSTQLFVATSRWMILLFEPS